MAEIKKPDGERLPGYPRGASWNPCASSCSRPRLYIRTWRSRASTGALELDLKELGPNDPFLKIVLNGKTRTKPPPRWSPAPTRRPAVRKQLMEGGEAAVDASTDPMIVLARKLDPMRREQIKWIQDERRKRGASGPASSSAKRASRCTARTTYPDATFTLRLSYGQVKGYPMNGTIAPPKTTFYGLYDRSASFDYNGPFYLPPRYRGRAAPSWIWRRRSIS